jgi:hypothetical protein
VTPRGGAAVSEGTTDEDEDGAEVAGTDDGDEECDDELHAANSAAAHAAITRARGARPDRERATVIMRPPSGPEGS